MNFRSATFADLDLVLHHRREMFREMGGIYEGQLELFESASHEYFSAALRDGSYYGLFAETGNTVIGGGGLLLVPWPGSPLNFDPRRAWIVNIYVEPAYRGQGFGRSITEALIEWCRARHFQSVALHASMYGRPLYEKLGFQSTNEMRLKL